MLPSMSGIAPLFIPDAIMLTSSLVVDLSEWWWHAGSWRRARHAWCSKSWKQRNPLFMYCPLNEITRKYEVMSYVWWMAVFWLFHAMSTFRKESFMFFSIIFLFHVKSVRSLSSYESISSQFLYFGLFFFLFGQCAMNLLFCFGNYEIVIYGLNCSTIF